GVGGRIVDSPGLQGIILPVRPFHPTPNNHLAAGPNGGVKVSFRWRVDLADWCPRIADWVITKTGFFSCSDSSTPNKHSGSSPNRGGISFLLWESGCIPKIAWS